MYNLAKLSEEIGAEGAIVDELVRYLDIVDPGVNFFLNGLSHAYIVETAMITGRLDAISGRAINRIADCFVRMDATPLDRFSRAYPFAYNLNALGEVGEAGKLFKTSAAYGGVSAFSRLIDQFSPDGEAKGSRVLMLGNVLIGLGSRLRGAKNDSTPMFDRLAQRLGWRRVDASV